MNEPLHSPHWYRIAELRPALRAHLRVGRHRYRGEVWYVIQDPASGRSFRFSTEVERIIALFDGARTVAEIWELSGRNHETMPTQDEILRLLSQLHHADALTTNVTPDVRELLQRYRDRQSRDWMARFANPLSIRTRLFDPDAFLTRTLPHVRPLFSRWGLMVWCAVVLWGAALAALHWPELGRSWSDSLLSPGSLVVALLVYPFIKVVHELAHGYVVKAHGGEVHEIGLMWLLLIPVPYVDASAATAFPNKRARMLVGAAGILAEVFIAALAMIVWAQVEPGLVRAVAYNVMLIAGLSTLFVNGNPLMRFDGYYVLADHLEIPNLAQRANAHMGYLLRKGILGMSSARAVSESNSERRWFAIYAPASFAYRLWVMAIIVLFIASWSRLAALIVGLWFVGLQFVYPAGRALRNLLREIEAHATNRPARLRAMVAVAALAAIAAVPLPLTTRAEGILWLPEQGELRAGTDGVLQSWQASPGTMVRSGQALAELDDPLVGVRLSAADADYRAAEARHLAARAADAVDAGVMLAQLQRAVTVYEAAEDRANARTLRSPTDGLFLVARPDDAPGRYYRQGDVIGYVVSQSHGTVVAVVEQDDIGLLKTRVKGVQVRLSENPSEVHVARIARLTPAGEFRLPSAALGVAAGGTIAVSPDDPGGERSAQPVFRVELTLERAPERLGGRAYVRFDHGYEPLCLRAYRSLQQLLLGRVYA